MTFAEIREKTSSIEEEIKHARLKNALEKLGDFIREIGDEELNKQILTITSQYNHAEKEIKLGLTNNPENINRNLSAITGILYESKNIAMRKATFDTGEELEKINKKADQAILRLEEMTKLMVESRKLEIEIFRNNFGPKFSTEINAKMEDHIKRFNQILEK